MISTRNQVFSETVVLISQMSSSAPSNFGEDLCYKATRCRVTGVEFDSAHGGNALTAKQRDEGLFL
jgi:hypothetical protein